MVFGPEYSSPTLTKYDPNHDQELQAWYKRTLMTRASLMRAKMEGETEEEYKSRKKALQEFRDLEQEHIREQHKKAGDVVEE